MKPIRFVLSIDGVKMATVDELRSSQRSQPGAFVPQAARSFMVSPAPIRRYQRYPAVVVAPH